jgi:hypothetical protein
MSVLLNMNEMIMNGTKSVVREAIMEISRVYNFDGEEACRMLELAVPVESKLVKSVKSVKSVKPKEVKEVRTKSVKSSFPLPFNGDRDMNCCQGLRQNHGLYTQCQGSRKDSKEFCNSCQSQCDKNGRPDYGTIVDRLNAHVEGVEFVDPSGKSPTAYSIVMKKLKLSREQVEEEAGKLNIIINPIHFEEVAAKKSGRPAKADKPEKVESKQKGRPKKSKKVLELAGEEEDLFASLVMSANKTSEEEMSQDEEDIKTVIMSDSEDDKEVTVEPTVESVEKPVEKKKKVISEAELLEKEQKKQALEAEKEAKKQALEAEKEAKKQALEAEKEAKRQALEAEKELAKQKKQALEAEKELAKQKKETERLEKEALAKQKKQAAEEEKAKKDSSKQKKTKKEEVKPASPVEEEEEADVVKKIEFEGKKYLKSKKTGIIYNMEQDVVGKWNEEKNRVDFNVEEEESEDEYEDDN